MPPPFNLTEQSRNSGGHGASHGSNEQTSMMAEPPIAAWVWSPERSACEAILEVALFQMDSLSSAGGLTTCQEKESVEIVGCRCQACLAEGDEYENSRQ